MTDPVFRRDPTPEEISMPRQFPESFQDEEEDLLQEDRKRGAPLKKARLF